MAPFGLTLAAPHVRGQTKNVEEHLAERISGVVDSAGEGELDTAGDEGVADVTGVRDGAGKPVEPGHREGVAGPDGR